MGYYVQIKKNTFMIPVENLDAAYEKMCKLNFNIPNKEKRGGSWGGLYDKNKAPEYGPYEGAWFSWMSWNYHETCKNTEDILKELGFEIDYDDMGNLHIIGYDSKCGQESLFLESISPLAKGYIVWKGEDDEIWGETYGKKEVIVKERRQEDYLDVIGTLSIDNNFTMDRLLELWKKMTKENLNNNHRKPPFEPSPIEFAIRVLKEFCNITIEMENIK